jgi:predicted protein tyrosine phosphatase
MPKYTTHVSRNVAQKLHPDNFPKETCIISINEPEAMDGEAKLDEGWFKVLRVKFWDVTQDIDHDSMGKILAMTEGQAKEIADFIKENRDRSILIHCRAGISRSAAIAEILFQLGWDDLPTEMRPYFMSPTDTSLYNSHVKKLLAKQFPELDMV